MEGSSDKLFCCRWVRRRVPLAHREELYHILRMTGPLLLSRILHYLLPFVVTVFCGRLGNEVMAGYGLASATINITTAATGCGLGLACDTLVAQVAALLKLQLLDKSNLVQWYQVFTCKQHICLEFEHLDKSLYDFMEDRSFQQVKDNN